MSYLKPYGGSYIRKFEIETDITPPTAQLKYNAQFVSDELDWKKYIAYHIVLPWTHVQNHANFNINFSTDVLPRMSSLAKLA